MAYLTDTFTDTPATLLAAHTGEQGASWTVVSVGDFLVTSQNRIRPDAAVPHFDQASGVPASNDGSITGIVHVKSDAGGYLGVAMRGSAGVLGYIAYYNSGSWRLWDGDFNALGSFAQALSNDQDYSLKLECVGTAIKVYIDGVLRISVTNSAHTTNQLAGVFGNGAFSDSTGMHLASVTAQDGAASSAVVVQSLMVTHNSWMPAGTQSLESNVTVGNTILVVMGWGYLACPPSLSDGLGNVYTEVGSHALITAAAGGKYYNYVFTAPVTVGGACTITLSAACALARDVVILEVSGLVASPYVTDSNAGPSTSSAADGSPAGTLPGLQVGDLVLALYSRDGVGCVYTQSTGYTSLGRDSTPTDFAEYKLATSTSESPTCTSEFSVAFPGVGLSAAFRASPSGRRFFLIPN